MLLEHEYLRSLSVLQCKDEVQVSLVVHLPFVRQALLEYSEILLLIQLFNSSPLDRQFISDI